MICPFVMFIVIKSYLSLLFPYTIFISPLVFCAIIQHWDHIRIHTQRVQPDAEQKVNKQLCNSVRRWEHFLSEGDAFIESR